MIASGLDDKTIRVWDVASKALMTILEGHGSGVNSVCFSPDGSMIASGSHDKTIRLWDAATGAVTSTVEVHSSSQFSVF